MRLSRQDIKRLVFLVREAASNNSINEIDFIKSFAKMAELIPQALGEVDEDDLDEEEKHPVETMNTAVMGKGMLYKGKKMKTPSQLSYGLDYTGSGMGEGKRVRITKRQLQKIIKEAMMRTPELKK